MMRNATIFLIGCMTALLARPVCAQHYGVFSSLDLSLNAGSTGVGLELATRLGDHVRLRAGYDAMPRFTKDLHFAVSSFDENGQALSTQFDQMASKLKELTGYEVKDYVDMSCKPTLSNFKFLVDVFPFRQNKFWRNFYVTAGFYWGSKEIGTAVNTIEGAQTLVGMEMYNHLYERCFNDEPLLTVNGLLPNGESIPVDVYLNEFVAKRIIANGRLAVGIGNFAHDIVDAEGNVIHKAGSTYMMEPDTDGTVKAWARTNAFKPYIGIGYGGRLVKGDDRYRVSFDCGMLFWGGKPSVVTHDGIDLSYDVTDLVGKVKDYVDLIGSLKVYPVLNIRFTRTIF